MRCTPPRRPCKPSDSAQGANLTALVRLYLLHHRPQSAAELAFFKDMPSLDLAIHHAALALDHRDKRYDHQRRLVATTLRRAERILTQARGRIQQCDTFHELHGVLEQLLIGVRGLGELYVYDTSLRLGALLGLAPEFVYLHRGTRAGARALGMHVSRSYLAIAELPAALRALSAGEIEDFLCIYKKQFAG